MEEIKFERCENSRGKEEKFVEKMHLSLEDLRKYKAPIGRIGKPICEDPSNIPMGHIPNYPRPVEFRVSEVTHVTDLEGLIGILESEGFKDPNQKEGVSWWRLRITHSNISSAERNYKERHNIAREDGNSFLKTFTTSPAFAESSPYGNFRFTFSLSDLLSYYREQICGGKDLKKRIYKTVLYRQEIVYVVLVHSSEVDDFDDYPLLPEGAEIDDSQVVCFDEDEIIWRAQAICETHKHVLKKTEDNTFEVEKAGDFEFYVWDQVSLAFHLPHGKVLKIPEDRLKKALSLCHYGFPCLARNTVLEIDENTENREEGY